MQVVTADSGVFVVPPTPSPPSSPPVLGPSLQVVKKPLPTKDAPKITRISESPIPVNDVRQPHVVPIFPTPPPPGVAGDGDHSEAEAVSRDESTSTLSLNAGPSSNPLKKGRRSKK